MTLQSTDELLPREKLEAKGPENLKDHELLAILLRTGRQKKNVLEISREILKKHSLEKLLELKLDHLKEIKGVGSAKASTLMAAFELSKRAFQKGLGVSHTILKPKDALALVSHIKDSKKEHFIAIYLNSRKQVIHQETISVGSLNESLVHPREAFQPAIQISASAVLFVHNHPSGDVNPSHEDTLVTKRLCHAGKLLGIEVVDHIIIAKENYSSLRELDATNQLGFQQEV